MGILDPLTNFPNGITTSVIVLTDYDYKDIDDGSIIFTNLGPLPFGVNGSALRLDSTIDISGGFGEYNGLEVKTNVVGNVGDGQINGLLVSLDLNGYTPPEDPLVTGIDVRQIGPAPFATYTGILVEPVGLKDNANFSSLNSGVNVNGPSGNTSGGSVTNAGIVLNMPHGKKIGGTGTVKNYGLWILGDGDPSATENWAIYSQSLASSFFAGPLSLKEIDPPIVTGGTNSHLAALTVKSTIDVTGAVTSDFAGMEIDTTVIGTNTSSNIIKGLVINLDTSAVVAPTIRPLGIGLDIFMTGASNFSSFTGIFFRGGTLPPPISGNYASQSISIAPITHNSIAGSTISLRTVDVTVPHGSAAAGGTVNNYGVYISGDGNAQATVNWALYSTSTAPSLLTGPLTVAVINDSADAAATVFGQSAALTLNSTLNVVGGANGNQLAAFKINILPTGVVPVGTSAINGIWMAPDYAGISGSNKPSGNGIYIAPFNTSNKLRAFTGFILDPFSLGTNSTGNSSADGIFISQMTNNSSGSAIVANRAINITLPQGDASAGGTATSYGIFIQGNGHASATANWAIYSQSTAPSFLTGPLSVSTITPPTITDGSGVALSALAINPTINLTSAANSDLLGLTLNTILTGVSSGTNNVTGLNLIINGSALSGTPRPGAIGLSLALPGTTNVGFYTGLLIKPSIAMQAASAGFNSHGIFIDTIVHNTMAGGTANTYGVYVTIPNSNASAGGTATNYGIYIGGTTNGAASANWALYVQNSSPSFFTGPVTAASMTAAVSTQDGLNGSRLEIRSLTELTTITTAATTSTTIQIPANAVVFAVSARVVTSIPTATQWSYGVTGTPNRYGNSLSVVAPSTFNGTLPGPLYYAVATPILITPLTNPATATGQVRFTIHYYIAVPATS